MATDDSPATTPAPERADAHPLPALIRTVRSGPLPDPEDLAHYDRVLPGAADRIVSMAERQAGHRQQLEQIAVRADLRLATMGMVLGYIAFVTAMGFATYLLINDKPIEGLVSLVVAIGAAFGPKLYRDLMGRNDPDTD